MLVLQRLYGACRTAQATIIAIRKAALHTSAHIARSHFLKLHLVFLSQLARMQASVTSCRAAVKDNRDYQNTEGASQKALRDVFTLARRCNLLGSSFLVFYLKRDGQSRSNLSKEVFAQQVFLQQRLHRYLHFKL